MLYCLQARSNTRGDFDFKCMAVSPASTNVTFHRASRRFINSICKSRHDRLIALEKQPFLFVSAEHLAMATYDIRHHEISAHRIMMGQILMSVSAQPSHTRTQLEDRLIHDADIFPPRQGDSRIISSGLTPKSLAPICEC